MTVTSPPTSADRTVEAHTELFTVLQKKHGLAEGLAAAGMTVGYRLTDAGTELRITPDGIATGRGGSPADVTFVVGSADSHELWSGRLSLPRALGTGRLVVLGRSQQVLRLVQLLLPAFALYPDIAERAGLS
ncbi:SCP2 sterol-binding domain-containing protein [Nocardiopsis sp. NPDC006198]|uniref:SCP2 sterol-binding domain-containing protein n=1 Tax=Nocardiopsis sp. NPDC006198 TaxID=3154472 RepID=UPI0033BCB849